MSALAVAQSTICGVWRERIGSGVFTRGQALQWAAAVVPLATGREVRGRRTNLTPGEAVELARELRAHPVTVDADAEAQGRRWLGSREARKLGVPPVELFARFEFEGDADDGRPVWRVVLVDGRTFDYCAVPWQARAYVDRWDDLPESWWHWSTLPASELVKGDRLHFSPGCGPGSPYIVTRHPQDIYADAFRVECVVDHVEGYLRVELDCGDAIVFDPAELVKLTPAGWQYGDPR